MDIQGASNVWLWWFKKNDDVQSMKNEIKILDDQLETEKQFPFKGDKFVKLTIRKKIMLQAKIRLLEGVANG